MSTHDTHSASSAQLATLAEIADDQWTSEWDEQAQAGTSTFHREGRTVVLDTDFTGTTLFWTRDDPNRFGKTHLDLDTAASYLKGQHQPF